MGAAPSPVLLLAALRCSPVSCRVCNPSLVEEANLPLDGVGQVRDADIVDFCALGLRLRRRRLGRLLSARPPGQQLAGEDGNGCDDDQQRPPPAATPRCPHCLLGRELPSPSSSIVLACCIWAFGFSGGARNTTCAAGRALSAAVLARAARLSSFQPSGARRASPWSISSIW